MFKIRENIDQKKIIKLQQNCQTLKTLKWKLLFGGKSKIDIFQITTEGFDFQENDNLQN